MNKITLGVVFSLGLVLRLLVIASRPLWYDEAIAILLAEKGLSAFIVGTLTSTAAGTAANVHPPAYFTFLSGWMRLFGNSLWSTRGFSVLVGMLTLGLVYLLCRELFDEKTALIQTFLVAISPFHIHYSQETRMYALLALMAVSATYALWKAIQTEKRIWWVLFTLSVVLAQYTHNLAVFYFIPLALIPMFKKDWKALRITVLSCTAAISLF